MTSNALVWIGAESPLFQYSPTRNGPIGSSWLQDFSGAICGGPSTFAVQVDGLFFSQVEVHWSTTGSFAVRLGLDGTLQDGQSASGATLSAPLGKHDIRLEVICEACSVDEQFTLRGIEIVTAMTGVNAALDDAAAEIKYSGFQTTQSSASDVQAIRAGSFYQDTVSYTSNGGASASLSFTGIAAYIFGPTGPSFGSFSLTLDGTPMGTYNASTTIDTYGTLLYFTSNLDAQIHQIVLTNLDDGKLLALDYAVAVMPDRSPGTGGAVPGGQVGGGVTSLPGGATTVVAGTTVGTTPTAVFPGQQGTQNNGGNNGAAGLAIGLTLGILAALTLLWMAWRYRQWKKAGGEGDFFVALCGARHRAKKAQAKADNKFKVWPMLSYKPKYAT